MRTSHVTLRDRSSIAHNGSELFLSHGEEDSFHGYEHARGIGLRPKLREGGGCNDEDDPLRKD